MSSESMTVSNEISRVKRTAPATVGFSVRSCHIHVLKRRQLGNQSHGSASGAIANRLAGQVSVAVDIQAGVSEAHFSATASMVRKGEKLSSVFSRSC